MNRRLLLLAASVVAFSAVLADQALAQDQQSAAATAVSPVSSVTPVNPAKTLPTTKELLQRYEAAIGGREAWSKYTSRYIKGLYQTEDASGFASIEIYSKTPNKSLSKITFANGLVLREVCDGKAVWLEDPSGGMHEVTGPALQSRLRHANFNDRTDALLMAVTGRVLRTEKVNTHDTYVLEFSPEKKILSKIYFDQETSLAVRADDTIHRDDGDYKVETYLDDYRPVDGGLFPYRMKHVEKGNVFTIRITQVKNNYPVDDTLFLKPASAPK